MTEPKDEDRPASVLIRQWKLEKSDTPPDDKRGLWAVVIGGGIFSTIPGFLLGAFLPADRDIWSVMIFGLLGAFVGALGGALLGVLAGLIGEFIASKLGLDRFLRARLDGRLDNLRGRILYGALVGALGGPIINIPLRFLGLGSSGPLAAALLGMVGGTIDWLVWNYRRHASAS